eukprot:TRINITY_DN7243_c0_g1_i10.p4 TRINITY_DN7243_c0_g1~~TRINITY_DN7243_c0_g1_i10.p4  ORF type:complete len:124 (+),score=7.78 TRINITY_DN7243_c0_g1_i10:1268-1639(+)
MNGRMTKAANKIATTAVEYRRRGRGMLDIHMNAELLLSAKHADERYTLEVAGTSHSNWYLFVAQFPHNNAKLPCSEKYGGKRNTLMREGTYHKSFEESVARQPHKYQSAAVLSVGGFAKKRRR